MTTHEQTALTLASTNPDVWIEASEFSNLCAGWAAVRRDLRPGPDGVDGRWFGGYLCHELDVLAAELQAGTYTPRPEGPESVTTHRQAMRDRVAAAAIRRAVYRRTIRTTDEE
jgi:hypothetical protein